MLFVDHFYKTLVSREIDLFICMGPAESAKSMSKTAFLKPRTTKLVKIKLRLVTDFIIFINDSKSNIQFLILSAYKSLFCQFLFYHKIRDHLKGNRKI